MTKTNHVISNKILRVFVKTGAAVICAILINQLIYSAIVPVIFFHAGFSESGYNKLKQTERMKEITVYADDSECFGWCYERNPDSVLLYFGGDSVDCSKWLSEALEYTDGSLFGDITLMTVDYPTFGKSRGTISERRFYKSVEALYGYARELYPGAKIYVMGYSIGAAAALWLSNTVSLDGIILVAPMYDGTSVYLPRGTVLHNLFEKVATVQMQNDELAETCFLSTLVIASEEDHMTNIGDIRALCELFPQQPEIALVPDCGHGEYWNRTETYVFIHQYLSCD